jgi:regulator-associated protein of mTOR
MRHGFEDEYNSEDYLAVLEQVRAPISLAKVATHCRQVFYMYYTDKRHESGGNPKAESQFPLQEWRMRDRLKTVSAALVLCLNIGVDPPGMLSSAAPRAAPPNHRRRHRQDEPMRQT